MVTSKILEVILDYITLGVGLIGIVIILCGVVEALIDLVPLKIRRLKNRDPSFTINMELIRYGLGLHILQGLQYIIVADIIHTFITPTLEELAILGVIVTIRVALGYFLGRENRRVNRSTHN